MSVYDEVSTLLACIQKGSAWIPLICSLFPKTKGFEILSSDLHIGSNNA